MKRKNVSWKLMVLAALLPILVVISINVSLGDELHLCVFLLTTWVGGAES